MARRSEVAGLELAAVYAAALRRPELVERAAAAYLRWPEATQVLDGSLDTLWRSILAPDEPDAAALPLDPAQKSWLLLHAGLLRGFNLALITAWRPSGDTLGALDGLYPGLLAYGEGLLSRATAGLGDLRVPPGGDRDAVGQVTVRARRLLRLGLERGYGLGFLVDAALAVGRDGEYQPPGDLAAALLREVGDEGKGDDPTLVAAADGLAAQLDRAGRQRVLGDLMGQPATRVALETTVARQSRVRPLAVPASIARFSSPYICTMLAFLLRWWLGVGLRLALAVRLGLADLPARGIVWERYPVRLWLAEQAHRWAREEVAEVHALAGNATELRWRLAYLAQTMAAVGWALAAELDSRRSSG